MSIVSSVIPILIWIFRSNVKEPPIREGSQSADRTEILKEEYYKKSVLSFIIYI